jgi:hypothetical protein
MTKPVRLLLGANALLLLWIVLFVTGHFTSTITYAQRPPATTAEGIPYFNANINPTDVPPMVNINPYQIVPKVEVTRLPELRVTSSSCQDRQMNFRTGIGTSITGPLVVTYLNLPEQSSVTLVDPQNGSQQLTLTSGAQIAAAIYLNSGQRLEFESAVMYSGCQPN